MAEGLQGTEEYGSPGNNDLGASRTDAGELSAARQIPAADILEELANLRSSGPQTIRLLPAGAGHAIDGADNGGCRCGRGNDAIEAGADSVHGGGQTLVDRLLQPV